MSEKRRKADWGHLAGETAGADALSNCLRDGTLVLVLGAGASSGVGLPGWLELVCRLRKVAGFPDDHLNVDSPADVLQSAAEEVERDFFRGDPLRFAQAVRTCLYEGINSLSVRETQRELLTALGALVAGKRRGSVQRIVTLNYDNVLEWYLSLHGIVVRPVSFPPGLEGSEDARIYHIHGYLPHGENRDAEIAPPVLGLSEIDRRLGTPGEPWFELLRHFFQTGTALFVGLSARTFEDRALSPVLKFVGDALDDRPTGFWLLPEADPAKPPADPESERAKVERGRSKETARKMLSKGVVPLFLGHKERIPDFLLGVCQRAASGFRP